MIFFSVVNDKWPSAKPAMPAMMRMRPTIVRGFIRTRSAEFKPYAKPAAVIAISAAGLVLLLQSELDSTHDQQNDDDDQNQSQTAARVVTPAAAVGPRRQ